MDAKAIRCCYLNTVNDQFDVTPISGGFVVWMPLYHSDGDGVTLTVRGDEQGWHVSDDGSTLSTLRSDGAAVDAPAFKEAWSALARPGSGFVPNDPGIASGEILAWSQTEQLGDTLNSVALASVRAEGLAFMREREGKQQFARTVRERLEFLLKTPRLSKLGITGGPGTVQLRSGRSKNVTATLETGRSTLAAFQAIGGRDKQTRESSYEHCFTIFSQAEISRDALFAVVRQAHTWDSAIINEIRDVSTVIDYESPTDLDAAVNEVVGRTPALA